jgi:hypothetical protein
VVNTLFCLFVGYPCPCKVANTLNGVLSVFFHVLPLLFYFNSLPFLVCMRKMKKSTMLMINSYLQSVVRTNPSTLIQLRLSITCLITVALNQQVFFSKYLS